MHFNGIRLSCLNFIIFQNNGYVSQKICDIIYLMLENNGILRSNGE